jgi:hypothetical protein
MLVLNNAKSGFVTPLDMMDFLTDSKAKELGQVDIKATRVDLLNCGFSDRPPEKEL